MLTTAHPKPGIVTNNIHVHSNCTDPSVRPEERKRTMGFGTWNERSLYRAGLVTAAAREIGRHN